LGINEGVFNMAYFLGIQGIYCNLPFMLIFNL
jgi:hypothetical protein